MNKAFSEVSAEPQPMFLCFSGDKCNAENNSLSVAILHACCQEYPTSATLWECSIKHNLWKQVLCNYVTSRRRCQECSHRSVFLVFFNNWPSTAWAIMCDVWDKLKQVPQQAASFFILWQEGELMNFWNLLLLLKRTQSVHFLQCCCLPAFFFFFYTSYNLLPCSLSWCTLLFCCWWWGCWTQSFDILVMIHKLLDGKIATFTILG